MGSMLAFAETGGVADIGIGHPTVKTMLIGAIGLDGVITAVIAIAFLVARKSAAGLHVAEGREDPSTGPEGVLRVALIVLAALLFLGGVAYELGPLLDSSKGFARELPFVTNSVVKVVTLAMLCAYAAYDCVATWRSSCRRSPLTRSRSP